MNDKFLWGVVVFCGIVNVLIISTSSGQVSSRIGTMLAFPMFVMVAILFVIFFGGYKRKNQAK